MHIRSRKTTVRCSNDDFLESKRPFANVFQEKVALRALTAIYAFVVPQDVLDFVQSRRVVLAVLTAITAHDFHSEATGHDLAFVAIFKACVLGRRICIVPKLPSFIPALVADLDGGAAGPDVRMGHGERVVEGQIAQGV